MKDQSTPGWFKPSRGSCVKNNVSVLSIRGKIDVRLPGIKRYLPNIDISRLHLDIAGIRPKIYGTGEDVADFRFDWAEENSWLDLWGMEAPALTASLAIAEHVWGTVKDVLIQP